MAGSVRADTASVRQAYQHCLRRARAHYENFPVASLLLPARLRGPVAAIYCYARDADDLADEDPRTPEERHDALVAMQSRVQALTTPQATDSPEWMALADTIQRFQLPIQPFLDLADAFQQDLRKTRYADFGEVMAYCRRSANPVGRLLLHLTGNAEPENLGYSDAICSALQLINFYQDLAQDFTEHQRIYLPSDEMHANGVTLAHIAEQRNDFRLHNLMQVQYARADRLLRSGAPLGRRLTGRFGLEIRMIVAGGARVLWRLQQQNDVFARPRLRLADGGAILWQALWRRTPGKH